MLIEVVGSDLRAQCCLLDVKKAGPDEDRPLLGMRTTAGNPITEG
jgi:hypothetical protein